MTTEFENSVFLISGQSPGKQPFGTGFIVSRDNNFSYVVTCRHVLDKIFDSNDIDLKKIDIGGKSPETDFLFIGDGPEDLAVLKVKDLKNTVPFNLCPCSAKEELLVKIIGCHQLDSVHQIKPIHGKLGEAEERVKSGSEKRIKTWILKIDEIREGYSGSPVINIITAL